MSKQDPADQVKFLVSCIGHTNNGRPDFQAVADELSIVTKAAAQKRYERMLKAHNVARPTANGGGETTPTSTPVKRKAKAEPAGSAKKKARGKAAKKESEDEDEDEDVKPKKKAVKNDVVKKEEGDSPDSADSSLTDIAGSDTGSA